MKTSSSRRLLAAFALAAALAAAGPAAALDIDLTQTLAATPKTARRSPSCASAPVSAISARAGSKSAIVHADFGRLVGHGAAEAAQQACGARRHDLRGDGDGPGRRRPVARRLRHNQRPRDLEQRSLPRAAQGLRAADPRRRSPPWAILLRARRGVSAVLRQARRNRSMATRAQAGEAEYDGKKKLRNRRWRRARDVAVPRAAGAKPAIDEPSAAMIAFSNGSREPRGSAFAICPGRAEYESPGPASSGSIATMRKPWSSLSPGVVTISLAI